MERNDVPAEYQVWQSTGGIKSKYTRVVYRYICKFTDTYGRVFGTYSKVKETCCKVLGTYCRVVFL